MSDFEKIKEETSKILKIQADSITEMIARWTANGNSDEEIATAIIVASNEFEKENT